MLLGKTALVTGSTSGIGLGIARTLAAGGADILLNGFGDAGLIEKLLAEFKSRYKVKAAYSPADISKRVARYESEQLGPEADRRYRCPGEALSRCRKDEVAR